MKCWIIQYFHRHGTDAFPWFADQEPSEEEVIAALDDWEGDERDDEWIEISVPYAIPTSNQGVTHGLAND